MTDTTTIDNSNNNNVRQQAAPHESKKFPVMYVNHGGGPMPLLGRQPQVVSSLRAATSTLGRRPSAILVISAHYETNTTTILTSERPALLYDYGGFPSEAYEITYGAHNSQEIVNDVRRLLSANNITFKEDNKRGYDHGVFVPLKIMYPNADIPVVCVSQPSSFNPQQCLKLGQALQPLRFKNVLILGSGASFHNFDAFFRSPGDVQAKQHDAARATLWNQWLVGCMTSNDVNERWNRVVEWERNAPHARFAHPREEHLMPLFVCVGAAGDDLGAVIDDNVGKGKGKKREEMYAMDVSQYVFGL